MPVLKLWDGADWVEVEALTPDHTHTGDYEPDGTVATHEAAADPHAGYVLDADLATHAADTTSVHGITDTSALETTTGSAAKVTTHEAAADPHAGYLKESVISGLATPAVVLGSAAAAGSSLTPIRSDSTIAAFDATSPTTQAFSDAAAVGSAAFAARRDHKHAMMADPVTAHVAAGDPHTGYLLEADAAIVTANRQTASYGLVLADAGKVVEMNVASANNLTVPLNSTQAFPVGTVIEVMQYGAGQTTIVATGGVTIRSPGGKLKIAVQYGGASLRKIATDEWAAEGNLAT